MDGIPALHLWDLVIEVFHFFVLKPVLQRAIKKTHQRQNEETPTNRDDLGLFNVDHVTTNAKTFSLWALYLPFLKTVKQ